MSANCDVIVIFPILWPIWINPEAAFWMHLLFIFITLELERKIYRNEMITAKDNRVPTLPARGPHASRPDYGKRPTQKTLKTSNRKPKPLTENAENSLILYCGFKTVLTDQVRANNHRNINIQRVHN